MLDKCSGYSTGESQSLIANDDPQNGAAYLRASASLVTNLHWISRFRLGNAVIHKTPK